MESFGKLKFVGEDLMVCNTKLVDIGALDEVGGEISCADSPLKKKILITFLQKTCGTNLNKTDIADPIPLIAE